MKRFIVFSILVLLASFSASAQLSKLNFGSYKITSIKPVSFTSLDGTVSVEVNNTGRHRITVQNINGIVYKKGTPFLIGNVAKIVIPQGKSNVAVSGNAALPSMDALFTLLKNPTIDPSSYSFDVSFEIKTRNGFQKVEKKNIPLDRVLKK